MTTSADLVARVRTNINEPIANADPQRLDFEIAQWLQDAQLDYISKIPADAIPELVEEKLAVGNQWTRTADFVKLLHIVVNHTISGTVTRSEQATILNIDEVYITLYNPGAWTGAWAQFRKDVIEFGPNAIGATIRYIRVPANISDCNGNFELDIEHEEPIVNYATAMALAKINDADAERYLQRYVERIQFEHQKYYQPYKIEKVRDNKA